MRTIDDLGKIAADLNDLARQILQRFDVGGLLSQLAPTSHHAHQPSDPGNAVPEVNRSQNRLTSELRVVSSK